MTLKELKAEVAKYQYIEDTGFIDVSLAAIIASRLKLGDPFWLILIGPSSSGKSQILRPLALTDPAYIHSVDDLTENTFLSASQKKNAGEMSLLHRIGPQGMIVISDLTGIFSKPSESRAAILSQLRMIYDGEMVKHSGISSKPIGWKGQIGIIAGSTPSIYKNFEEVATMGERFMYYRLKDYSAERAGHIALNRKGGVGVANRELTELYDKYLKEVVLYTASLGGGEERGIERLDLGEDVKKHIVEVAMFAEKIRTVATFDWKNESITTIPIVAMPMRTSLQLAVLGRALLAMKRHEMKDERVGLERKELDIIDWCAYSLANEEKRACLRVLATLGEGKYMSTAAVGDAIGLPTGATRTVLQILSSIKVVDRSGDDTGLMWRLSRKEEAEFIRRVEGVMVKEGEEEIVSRETTMEEEEEREMAANQSFEQYVG